jgi:hypothetical protein
MLGAHIQTIPGHFDPFSSIICDMGSNKFQWVFLFGENSQKQHWICNMNFLKFYTWKKKYWIELVQQFVKSVKKLYVSFSWNELLPSEIFSTENWLVVYIIYSNPQLSAMNMG